MIDFLVAEAGIRQLHARFVDAVWRQDGEAFANCFTPDGEWKLATLRIKGRDEIATRSIELLGLCKRIHLIVGIPLLEIDGNTATGRVSMTELAKINDGSAALTIGVYYDRYERSEDGLWHFSWRHFGLHYRGPTDLSADLVDCPDYGPPPALPEPNAPTFTRRKV